MAGWGMLGGRITNEMAYAQRGLMYTTPAGALVGTLVARWQGIRLRQYWQSLGVGALYLGPVFESHSHGFDIYVVDSAAASTNIPPLSHCCRNRGRCYTWVAMWMCRRH